MSAKEFRPDWASAPGETLLDLMQEHGYTQALLAEVMQRPKKTINEIIKGKCAITPETALQLEDVFGVSAEFWVRREALYRLALARLAAKQ